MNKFSAEQSILPLHCLITHISQVASPAEMKRNVRLPQIQNIQNKSSLSFRKQKVNN